MKIKGMHKRKAMRASRSRAKIFGTKERPRLAVFRSNKFVSVQLIDDTEGKTLAHFSSSTLKAKGNKTEAAKAVGGEIAKRAIAMGLKQAVFDRRSYRYHGRVRALAEAAREGGLKI